jgi:hypothetical protein
MTVRSASAASPATSGQAPYALELPIAPSSRLPAVIPKRKQRSPKTQRLLRMVAPYAFAAGVIGATVTASATALIITCMNASFSLPAPAKPAHQQPEHLSSVQAAFAEMSIDEVRTMHRQIEAAKNLGMGFAVEPAPLSSQIKDVTLYWTLRPEEVPRMLALHGQLYVGLIGPTRGYKRGLLELPSAKAITTVAELRSYLADFAIIYAPR